MFGTDFVAHVDDKPVQLFQEIQSNICKRLSKPVQLVFFVFAFVVRVVWIRLKLQVNCIFIFEIHQPSLFIKKEYKVAMVRKHVTGLLKCQQNSWLIRQSSKLSSH